MEGEIPFVIFASSAPHHALGCTEPSASSASFSVSLSPFKESSDHQQWIFFHNGVLNALYSLAITCELREGGSVLAETYKGEGNQILYYEENTEMLIVGDFVLERESGGSRVFLSFCSGKEEQRWQLVPAPFAQEHAAKVFSS